VLWDAAPGSTIFVVRLCVIKCSCVVFPSLHIRFSSVVWDASVDAATCTSTLESKMERILERSTTLLLNSKPDCISAKYISCAGICSMTQGALLQLDLTTWLASAHRALCHKDITGVRPFKMLRWHCIDGESITGHFIHLYTEINVLNGFTHVTAGSHIATQNRLTTNSLTIDQFIVKPSKQYLKVLCVRYTYPISGPSRTNSTNYLKRG